MRILIAAAILIAALVITEKALAQTIVTRGPHGDFYETKRQKPVHYDSTCFMFYPIGGGSYRVYKHRRTKKYFYFVTVKGSLCKKYLIQ